MFNFLCKLGLCLLLPYSIFATTNEQFYEGIKEYQEKAFGQMLKCIEQITDTSLQKHNLENTINALAQGLSRFNSSFECLTKIANLYSDNILLTQINEDFSSFLNEYCFQNTDLQHVFSEHLQNTTEKEYVTDYESYLIRSWLECSFPLFLTRALKTGFQQKENLKDLIWFCKEKDTETEFKGSGTTNSKGETRVEGSVKRSKESKDGPSYSFEIGGAASRNKKGKVEGEVSAEASVKF